MNTQFTDPIKAELWRFIKEMNSAWTKENAPEKLIEYFHERMIVLNPVQNERIEGGKACVSAWTGFVKATNIIKWEEINPIIEIYGEGNFAVVSYYFDMIYEMGGIKIDMKGRDLFALVKENSKWLIISDEFSANPC